MADAGRQQERRSEQQQAGQDERQGQSGGGQRDSEDQARPGSTEREQEAGKSYPTGDDASDDQDRAPQPGLTPDS